MGTTKVKVKVKAKPKKEQSIRKKTTICIDTTTRAKLQTVSNKAKVETMDSTIRFLLKNQKKV